MASGRDAYASNESQRDGWTDGRTDGEEAEASEAQEQRAPGGETERV